VAILDTGCDSTHPDLKERIVGGRNFTNDDGGKTGVYQDYNGHGTHVAGTIAATQNNNGVVGVAPEANLLIIKVLDKNGSGQYTIGLLMGLSMQSNQKLILSPCHLAVLMIILNSIKPFKKLFLKTFL
jgi:major intracellular serine protease